MRINKTLTVVATAAALVAGVAFAQTNVQPDPNTTGQPGSTIGAQPADSGSTMSNSGSTVDSGTTAAQTDITTPEPRADRN